MFRGNKPPSSVCQERAVTSFQFYDLWRLETELETELKTED